jgi:hypothetical protein
MKSSLLEQGGFFTKQDGGSVYAKQGESLDEITTYDKNCPKCKTSLIIVTNSQGKVLSVKHAPTIEK